ncbi:hypothetical protein EB093_04250 [bacterium]|nr:hypothetical protein [bacterium]
MKILRFLLFVLLPVILMTSGEFLLKHSINTSVGSHVVTNSPHSLRHLALVSNPKALLAVGCITLGGIIWLMAMARYELSFIYPFLSLNYIAIVIGSQWILGETVNWTRYASLCLIIVGLVFISRSPNSETS